MPVYLPTQRAPGAAILLVRVKDNVDDDLWMHFEDTSSSSPLCRPARYRCTLLQRKAAIISIKFVVYKRISAHHQQSIPALGEQFDLCLFLFLSSHHFFPAPSESRLKILIRNLKDDQLRFSHH